MSNKPLLNLSRIWRDVDRAPESDPHRFLRGMFNGGSIDPGSFGYYQLEALAKHHCLFFLGRPGAGKSKEVERLTKGEVPGFADENVIRFECREFSPDIYGDITRSPEWKERDKSGKPVRLIIDGLDEGLLKDGNYFQQIIKVLKCLRSENPALRLLLTCRPAEWSRASAETINEMWNCVTAPKVFALESLSEDNQKELIRQKRVANSEEFIQWVEKNNFEEFAEWPRSLEWLAEEFNGPDKAKKLTYTELCRRRVYRSFGEDERYAAAGQTPHVEAWSHAIMVVAGVLVFCGRKGVSLVLGEADCLTMDEIFSQSGELKMEGHPKLTREHIREALQKSHLTEKHGGYYRFQNQSDMEFLASSMLAELPIEQIAELFGTFSSDGDWQVFPQLATTAANLAAQSPEFFDYLLEHDPRVLMRSDFGKMSGDKKKRAVQAILECVDKANSTGEHSQHSHLATLKHPTIESQIEPWIFDEQKEWPVRDFAFDIALACAETSFWEKRWDMPGNCDDPFLRGRLPIVIRRFGKDWPQHRLLSIAAFKDNRVAGSAMKVLLERGVRPREIVTYLREPDPEAFDSYNSLLREIGNWMDVDDVAPLLEKITPWFVSEGVSGATTLTEALVRKAVSNLNRSDIQNALVRFLFHQHEKDNLILVPHTRENLSKFGLEKPESRKALLLTVMEVWPESEEIQIHRLWHSCPVSSEDIEWVLEEIAQRNGLVARMLSKTIRGYLWNLDERYRECFERTYEVSSELRAVLPPAEREGIFITLQRLREEEERQRDIQFQDFNRKRGRPAFDCEAYFNKTVELCREGRHELWLDVCFALSAPVSANDHRQFLAHTDIRELAGWQSASESFRDELRSFARNFLLHVEVSIPKPQQITDKMLGVIYALSIHAANLTLDSDLLAAMKPVWALALVRHCASESTEPPRALKILAGLNPGFVTNAWKTEFEERWGINRFLYNQLLPAGWSPEVEAALAETLMTASLQPEAFRSGLMLMFGQNETLATQIAQWRLEEYTNQKDSAPRRTAIAACLFISHSLWEKAWPFFTADSGAARQLLLEQSEWLHAPEFKGQFERMSTSLLAGLFSQFIQSFPLSEAPRRKGTHILTPLDLAYDLHASLQRILESRGSLQELKHIHQTYGLSDKWRTGESLSRAKQNELTARRHPPSATEFLSLIQTKGGTLVRDNDSLQQAILRSLSRFGKSLHPNLILRLWNEDPKAPRSEATLQFEIADHLRRDLKSSVVNMETKVEGKEGNDIRVQAGDGQYVVTVEVKMGHSKDEERPLKAAMQTQLRDNYLKKLNETHGIYVVGWYFCQHFRPGGIVDMKTIASAEKYFGTQAIKLSKDGYRLGASVIDCRWLSSITAKSSMRKKQTAKRARSKVAK